MPEPLPPNPDQFGGEITPDGGITPCGSITPCGTIDPCSVIDPCGIVTPCGSLTPCGADGIMNPCQLIGEDGIMNPCEIIGEEGLQGAVGAMNPCQIIGEDGLRGAVAPDMLIGENGLAGTITPCGVIETPARPTARPIGRSIPFGLLSGGVIIVLLMIACAFATLGPGRELVQNLIAPPTEEAVETEVVLLPTKTDPPPDEPTETVTDTLTVGGGACEDICDPAASNCLAGLNCLPRTQGGDDYICWNDQICGGSIPPDTVTEPPTEVSTQPVTECGPGWLPTNGGCSCCGTTLVCADGTVAQFNPACMGGPNVTPAFCGDNVCNGGETCWTCSWDCGPC